MAGFETSLIGKGKIGPIDVRVLVGYSYNYPGNLEDFPEQRNIGVFIKNAIKGIGQRLTESRDLRVISLERNNSEADKDGTMATIAGRPVHIAAGLAMQGFAIPSGTRSG